MHSLARQVDTVLLTCVRDRAGHFVKIVICGGHVRKVLGLPLPRDASGGGAPIVWDIGVGPPRGIMKMITLWLLLDVLLYLFG